jgi:outer membrane lipoprotein-sorting protein
MIKYTLLSLLFVFFAGQVNAIDGTILFDSLKRKVLSVNDYTADVKMKINVHYMKIPQLSGTMYYKSPDMLRLERHGGLSILPKKNINLTLSNLIPNGEVTIIDLGYTNYKSCRAHVLKVIPENDNSTIILAKIWIDEERLLAIRTETTTRNDGTVAMDLNYGKYQRLALPDSVVIYLNLKEYKMPEGVTMDYNKQSKNVKVTEPKDTKGKIEIAYLNYNINTGLSNSIFERK